VTITVAEGRAPRGWTVDDPPERIVAFLNWYVHERNVGDTVKGYAEVSDVPLITINKWLRDQRVLTLLDRHLYASNAGPVRVQAVLDMLHMRAVRDQDVKAAQVYLSAVDKLVPKRQVDVVIHDARQLSDQELHKELSRAIALLEEQRGVAPELDPVVEEAEVLEDTG
jgi:hypothetical protein